MSRFWLKPTDCEKYDREIGPYPTEEMAQAMAVTYECVYDTKFKVVKRDE